MDGWTWPHITSCCHVAGHAGAAFAAGILQARCTGGASICQSSTEAPTPDKACKRWVNAVHAFAGQHLLHICIFNDLKLGSASLIASAAYHALKTIV